MRRPDRMTLELRPPHQDLAAVAPLALIVAALLGLAAVAAEVPALVPAGVVAGAATAMGMAQVARRPTLALGLAAPSLLLGAAIATGIIGPTYAIALAALAAGCFAGHPAVLGLIVLTSVPVFLVGWGIPPVYLAGWAYAALLRIGARPQRPLGKPGSR